MGFTCVQLADDTVLAQLARELDLAAVTDGRLGNHITRPEARGVPLVRTTTRYPAPARCFSPLHDALVEQVRVASADAGVELAPSPFNNALVELYDGRYRKMGYHSDQALDLATDSHIAIVSCYLTPDGELWPDAPDLRQLVVKPKGDGERFMVPLCHASVVLFSVSTNASHLHKIVLPQVYAPEVRWFGITLRRSHTFVDYRASGPCFADGTPLRLANDEEGLAFYRLRGQENRSEAFAYPPLPVTLSPGDLLPPTS